MGIALSVKNIVKRFGSVLAVDQLSFDVQQGSCFGLLGPNGAGKTTTLEIIEGINTADSGEVRYPLLKKHQALQTHIGIQFQETALQDHIRVHETLRMFSDLYHVSRDYSHLIELCALGEFLDRETKKLSGGQRQRLLLALALIADPDILFLDEPTTGLDPQSRRNFWALMKEIKASGKTLVLTTHYMEEAYQLCDEIIIVDHGKIIEQGRPKDLLKKHFTGSLIRLPKMATHSVALPFAEFKEHDEYIEINSIQVDTDLRKLMELGVSLNELYIHKPNLDDLFLKLTGQELRA